MATHGTLTQVRYVRWPTGRSLLRQAWNALAAMSRARRTRRLLGEMNDRMLADIGIGRGDALMEASRAPWDISSRR